MDMDTLTAKLGEQVERLKAVCAAIGDGIAWYPYDILANLVHIDGMLQGKHRNSDERLFMLLRSRLAG